MPSDTYCNIAITVIDGFGAVGADCAEPAFKLSRQEGRMPRSGTNGKICYVEIPATDIARSSDFYRAVFGWNIRRRGDGRKAFDDATGQVSGTWVLGHAPGKQPGLLIYVMVDNV